MNTRQTIRNKTEIEMNNDSDKNRNRERNAERENMNPERVTGKDPQGEASSFRGTPHTAKATRHQNYVAGFKYMMQRAKALRESTSRQLCKSSSSDS